MIVADSNIIAYLLLDGPHTSAAEEVLTRDNQWAVPLLWRSEFRSILSIYLRKNILDIATASAMQEEAESIVADNEYTIPSGRLLQFISTSPCSAYDCEFIWLAKELQVPLVTCDKQILRHYPSLAMSPEDYCK